MKVMGIRAIYPRPRTSDPCPGHKIYPYLLGGISIDRPGQVYATDITYILGRGWQNLSSGDKVTVNIVHVPSGKVIFGTDIAVTEG